MPVAGKLRRMSSISFVNAGVVGVDIKSHQQGCAFPFAVLVAGNASQDAGCSRVIGNPPPVDLPFPTGGLFCFLSVSGSMVFEPPREVVRQTLRMQSLLQWSGRRVQGKVASLQKQVFGASLFPGWYTC